jgi:hypothetical protein
MFRKGKGLYISGREAKWRVLLFREVKSLSLSGSAESCIVVSVMRGPSGKCRVYHFVHNGFFGQRRGDYDVPYEGLSRELK